MLQHDSAAVFMQKIHLLAAVLLFVTVQADPGGPGAVLSVAQSGVNGWVGDFTGKLSGILGNLQIPDQEIHFSHGDVKLTNMHTHDFGNQTFQVTVTPNPGVEVSATFVVMFAFNFHYNVAGIAGNGQCEFKFTDSSATASANLGVQNNSLVLTSTDASVTLSNLGHDCNGISGNILNVLLDQFNSQVKNLVESEGTSQLKDALTKDAAPALQKVNFDFAITHDFALVRFDPMALTYDKEANALVVALRGDIVQKQDLADPPGTYPRSLPPWDTAFPNSDLQFALSQWSLQTGLVNYQRAGRLAYDIVHTDIPASSPLQLKTGDFVLVAPGLVLKYGMKSWMRIALALEEGTNVTMTPEEGLSVTGPAGVIFQVVNETDNSTVDAFALRLDLDLSVNASVVHNQSSYLSLAFTAISFPTKVVNSTVGPVLLLPPLLNFMSFVVEKLGIPLINAKFMQGIPLPSSPQVHPNKSQVAIRQEYLVVASDIIVTPTE